MPMGEKTQKLWEDPKYKEEMSKKHRGQHNSSSTEFKKGNPSWNAGTKKYYSKICKCGKEFKIDDNRQIYCSKSCGSKGKSRNLGKIASLDTRKKLSDCHKGSKSYLWKGGITEENHKLRTSFEYRNWKKEVFERDDFTCQICNQIGTNLEAHHIKQFALYPELRFEIDNGVTLCKNCHKEIDVYRSLK